MVFLRESYLIHPLILLLFDPFVTAASAFWAKLSNVFLGAGVCFSNQMLLNKSQKSY